MKKYAIAAACVLFFLICGEGKSYGAIPSTYDIEGKFVIWKIEKVPVWRFPKSSAGEVSELSGRFNNLYKAGFKLEQLRVDKASGKWSLFVGKQLIYSVPPEYARSIKQDPQKVALQMMSRVYEAIGEQHAAALTPAFQIKGKYAVSGSVSWYGDKFIGKKFANGERFTETHLTAAAKNLPFGTLVRITVPSGKSVVVRVTDRFKEHKNRVLDISHAAAELLGIKTAGTPSVRVEVIGRVDRIGGK
jgi:rare lipoprotein A